MWNFPFLPEQASTFAAPVDNLYLFIVAITAFFTVVISLAVAYIAVKYHERKEVDRTPPAENPIVEATWIGVPTVIVMVIFFWSCNLYFTLESPPANAVDMYVTGKQWMWKIQHPTGQREINELHVPTGQPIRLTMVSQDVIHSFYIPAFRIKQDVLPGRYSQLWFEATKPGVYHLFCAEYCGTKHSGMIGRVVVMEPKDYERWLAGGGANAGSIGGSMASGGEKVFNDQGCISCHVAGDPGRAPLLAGLYGSSVTLATGEKVTADEQYIRESIMRSQAKIVAGYGPVMPVYEGRISEDDVMLLVAYVKSLGSASAPAAAQAAPAATTPAAAAAPAKPAERKNETSRTK